MTYIWQTQPLQLVANTVGKFSIAALLVTLHGPRYARTKSIFIWSLAAVQSIICVIGIAMIYAQCNPVAKLWQDPSPKNCPGRTRNQNFAYAQGDAIANLVIWNTQVTTGLRDIKLTEMYLVLLAGSLPGLRPLFNKRIRMSSKRNSSYEYPSRQRHINGAVLKLSSLPAGRSKAYASSSNNRTNNESTENFAAIGDEAMMKTTDINVSSGKSSVRGQAPCQQSDGPSGTAESDLEVGRISV
ncbi:MAG: hypothetical protein Q9179_003688 [Wetmoreana sp. 5 TL-2023]